MGDFHNIEKDKTDKAKESSYSYKSSNDYSLNQFFGRQGYSSNNNNLIREYGNEVRERINSQTFLKIDYEGNRKNNLYNSLEIENKAKNTPKGTKFIVKLNHTYLE